MPIRAGTMQKASITLCTGLCLCRFTHISCMPLCTTLHLCYVHMHNMLYAKCQGCVQCSMYVFMYNPHNKPAKQIVSFSNFKKQGLEMELNLSEVTDEKVTRHSNSSLSNSKVKAPTI